MKKTFVLIISLFVITFIVQTVIINRLSNKNTIYSQQIARLVPERTQMKSKVRLLSHLYEQSFKLSGTKLNEILVENNVREKISLNDICNKKLKLVYYFNEYSCLACVDEELIRLNEVIDSIGKENVMVIASFSSYKDFYQFICRNDIPCDIYNTNGNQFMDIDKKDESIIFTVNDDLIVGKCFIPMKSLSHTTKDFYNTIVGKYFTK